MSGPNASQEVAVSSTGVLAISSPCACSRATIRSRREPSSGGIGAGGIRLWNAAASRSLPLGKCR